MEVKGKRHAIGCRVVSKAVREWRKPTRSSNAILPKRKLIIEKRIGLFDLGWSELWEYRELLYALVGRELKATL